jgi:hypothetical protein
MELHPDEDGELSLLNYPGFPTNVVKTERVTIQLDFDTLALTAFQHARYEH